MRQPLIYLMLVSSSLFALDDLDRISADYQTGRISFDEFLISQVARMVEEAPIHAPYWTDQPIKCGTHVLKMLGEEHHRLSDSAKEILSQMGIDFDRSIPGFQRPSGLDQTHDSGIFRFHYTTEGTDAVDPEDAESDGVPDYVNHMASVFNEVANLEIDNYGFFRPPSDEWYVQEENGGDGLYDIYIMQLGANLYGYTQWESRASSNSGDNEFSPSEEKNAYTSYLVMRNNYDNGFPPELQSIQVTAAHEFFHSIQFGYDGFESTWLLEATATWMEDEAYTDINDNYQYLKVWFQEPHIALDQNRSPHWYGSWIFFRYVSEHIGGHSTIRKIFEESIRLDSGQGDFSIRTIDAVLRGIGSSFRDALKSMAIANQVLSSDPTVGEYTYSEADGYRADNIKPSYKESIILFESEYHFHHGDGNLMRNASHYIEVTAAEGALEVTFTGENAQSTFQVIGIVQTTAGKLSVQTIGANSIMVLPSDAEKVTVAVVTDTSENANYNYTMILDSEVQLPSSITLYPNFPNPFNETTTLRFYLPEVEKVSLIIYDLRGRQVENIFLPELKRGFNDATFTSKSLSSGVYVARLKGKSKSVTRKLTLVK